MKIVYLIILYYLFLFILPKHSHAFQLNPQAEISLLTCSPGNEVYSVYGHSAIRVKDVTRDFDLVFNYGLFDFSAPSFLYRFAKGHTDYFLGVKEFSNFVEEYIADRRSIYEQVLNLVQDEKQQLFDFLLWNARPENRVYRYNFFFDNCATRIRDIVMQQAEGEVKFPVKTQNQKTFRDLIKEYHSKMAWLNFGIDLVVAAPSDQNASAFDEMFLPHYLMLHFNNTVIQSGNETRPLVKSTRMVYRTPETSPVGAGLPGPLVVFGGMLLIVAGLSANQFINRRTIYLIDYFIFGLTGLAGFIMWWFVLFSEHPAMAPNYNLLWAFPPNLIFAFIWKIKKWRPISRYYFPVITIWNSVFLLLSFILPQQFHVIFYLILVMVLCRSVLNSLILFNNGKQKIIRAGLTG